LVTVPDFLQSWLGSDPQTALLLDAGVAVLLLVLAAGLWLRFGSGPRRRRVYQRVLRLLHENNWSQALKAVGELQRLGRLSPMWQGRVGNAEGQCHRLAGEAALQDKHYEDALDHLDATARLLSLREADGRDRVFADMLAEIRCLFATGRDTGPVQQLVTRVLQVQSPCPEASFWQGLCHVRDGRNDLAIASLRTAREGAGNQVIDPPLYLGALLRREGQAQEGLRYLAEANRIDPDCPLVTWQLGMALCEVAAAGGDGPGVRALQRALGPQGLANWVKTPQLLWKEGLPGLMRSFVRRLTADYPYVCPVLGGDVGAMLRQGRLVLARAQYRLGNFPEAAHLFDAVLQESPPSVPLLRGLGLALARLGRYDQAFKHLRAAHEQEQPKSHLTAGYLALCGARGKPLQPEDKAQNISWAVRLLAQFDVRGDAEWASLYNAIFAEAREGGLALPADDQARLCEVLASVEATDPAAAAAFAQLAACRPEAVRPEYAWLYCRAAQQHGVTTDGDLELFGRAFRDEASAQAFFDKHGWDFDGVESAYLERCAARQPGAFPEALGPDYAPRGERLLLERSRRQEEAGRGDAALASADVLLRLAPRSPWAHDRLAQLAYRRGDLDRAAAVLGDWQSLEPANHLPLVRRAVIEQRRGHPAASAEAIDRALGVTRGRLRAAVAFLGGKLALASGGGGEERQRSLRLFEECLRDDPGHGEALACAAAVRLLLGDWQGLASQAAAMDDVAVRAGDARFPYLAAVCHLAAGNYPQVAEAARRAAADPSLAVESSYLAGLAQLRLNDNAAAAGELRKVADSPGSPSADHARALLGHISLHGGAYDEAVRWWGALDSRKRAEWQLEHVLQGTVFLSALRSWHAGDFEQAAAKLQEADRLGCRDPRLASLRVLSLVRAGQQLLYSGPNGRKDTDQRGPARLLEEALEAGCQDAHVAYLLALAYKRQGKPAPARAALDKIDPPDANVHLQKGLLFLRENQLPRAEQEFARASELEPDGYAACHNLLLTRLSLGQLEPAAALVPRVIELAPRPEEQRPLALLQLLLRSGQSPNGDSLFAPALAKIAAEDEQRLLGLVRGLGRLDAAAPLLKTLALARPLSAPAWEAHLEAVLAQGQAVVQRCRWAEAERLLAPAVRDHPLAARPTQAALLNLLGCCACLGQNFEGGKNYFAAALRLAPADARLLQNLALACEWDGRLEEAEPHWNRYFDALDHRVPAAPGRPDYVERLRYEALNRLATCFSDKEQWPRALVYLQRAQRLRSEDPETLERLFHLYTQAQRSDEAARVLRKLRQLQPGEPLFELYELEIEEVQHLDDTDRLLGAIDRVLKKHPNDPRLEERAGGMVLNVVASLNRQGRQLSEQLDKALARLRRLPNNQAHWPEMDDFLCDVRGRLNKVKRITAKCLLLASTEQQRHTIRDLRERVDRDVARCNRWVGD
jgi:Flp pilus assembly protein TadD